MCDRPIYPFPRCVSSTISDFYIENGIKGLFKWQSDLLEEAFKTNQNLVYSAPTSSGKSIVAELLGFKCAENKKKVIFVLPYISVAKEKLHQIQKCWRRANIEVCGFIGPNSSHPSNWAAAICTIEKASSLVNRAFTEEWISDIGMIIVDELHMIFDSSRGTNIEFMLTKINYFNNEFMNEKIRIIGMSATIPKLEKIADWLHAMIRSADFRPIKILEKVVINRSLKEIKNGLIMDNICYSFEENENPVLSLAMESFINNKPTLIMVSSKIDTEKIVVSLALMLKEKQNKNKKIMEILNERTNQLLFTKNCLQRNGCKDKNMMAALAFGISFHHAGLTIEERECIEEAFRDKTIIILVATSTLASGVNLPAERVIIKCQTRGPTAINPLNYRQMIGRCGRMGHAKSGESFLIVQASDEKITKNVLFSTIDQTISNNLKHVETNLSKFFLESISIGLICCKSELVKLSEMLLFKPDDFDIFNVSIEKLKVNGFIAESISMNDHQYGSTQLGKAALASALPPDAALSVFEDLNIASRSIALDTELHMLFLVTPINESVWQECDWHHLFDIFNKLPSEHRRVAKLIGCSEQFLLEQMMRGKKDSTKNRLYMRFFSSLALFDVINELSIFEVSQKYRISRGCLQTLQVQSATYAAMIVAFCQRLGWTYLKSLLDGFAMRLAFGVRSELSELVMIDGIDGQRARVLHEKGITCLSQLICCEPTKIAQYLSLAVPYSSLNENDGKGEWLFGEERIQLNEAVEILKNRAKKMMMRKVEELGLGINLKITEEIQKNGKEESRDSGVEMKWENEESETIDNISKNLSEVSFVENSFEEHEETVLNDEKDEIQLLENSLMKMKPIDKKIGKRLSKIFSPITMFEMSENYSNRQSKKSIVKNQTKRNSIIANCRIENKNDSMNSSIDNKSFDVFLTPPPKDNKKMNFLMKHSRNIEMTNSPLSNITSSPIIKHKKWDSNIFLVENVCSNQIDWNNWLKTMKEISKIGISIDDMMNGIGISSPISTVFIPLTENLQEVDHKIFDYFVFNISKCVISLKHRMEAVNLLLNFAEVYVYSLETCFTIFKKFHIQIKNPKIILILADLNHSVIFHENQEIEKKESMKEFIKLSNDVEPKIEEIYKNENSEIIRSIIEAFIFRKSFQLLKMGAIQKSSEQSVNIELEASKVVLKMHYNGIPIDSLSGKRIIEKVGKNLEKLEEKCWKLALGKFNLNSSKQVANVLFKRLGLIYPEKKINNKFYLETNKSILEQIVDQHEIVANIIQYRHIYHIYMNCLKPIENSFKENVSRIYCTFSMATTTGRILTMSPNIQNFPKKESFDGVYMRKLLKAKPGYLLIGADYCQLELRVLAHMSGDLKLIDLIEKEHDIFHDLSIQWNFPRDAVKQLCYGLIYGMGVQSLAELTKMTKLEAEKMWNMFFDMFPSVKSYISETKENAFRDGFVRTILGRKRITNLCKLQEEKNREERICVNYVIQGSASEIFKQSIIDINQKLINFDAFLVLTIHDEIIVESNSEEAEKVGFIIVESMQNSLKHLLRVPMKVSLKTGNTWADLK